MTRIVVLMYHALYRNADEFGEIPSGDRAYALPVDVFEKQLDNLQDDDIPILSPNDIMKSENIRLPDKGVLLTFDDGDISFYKYAFPMLAERALSAVFFVTSDLIQSGKQFCSWTHLAEMSRKGMWIQSHGKTHRFLSDIDAKESRWELAESKSIIEDKIGQHVCSISFPGGRYSSREIDIGRSLGYRYFYTSKVGTNTSREFQDKCIINRISIKQKMTLQTFKALVSGDRTELMKRRIFSNVKDSAKKLLGNRLYHALYRLRSS